MLTETKTRLNRGPDRALIEEMKPMLPMHWKELALNQDRVPLSPQYHVYDERDAQGMVMASRCGMLASSSAISSASSLPACTIRRA
jgi:hypothetical protein